MKFSIVIPAYNRATVVSRTLQSVLEQTHRPLQLILVDNKSDDDTLNVFNQFAATHQRSDFEIIVTQELHHTASAARNRGAALATGEWLMFFDSDDVMLPDLVARYAQYIERRHGEVDLVSAAGTLIMPSGQRRAAPFFRRDLLANQILHSQLATQRYAVRRAFFERTDGWNINLSCWNDWEMAMRLLLARPRIGLLGCRSSIEIYHNRPDSITGTEFGSRHGKWEHAIDILENEVRCSQLRAAVKQRCYKLLHFRRLTLAAHYEHEGRHDLATPLAQTAMRRLRESYGNSRRWRWWVAPVTRRLYAHMAAGKRGAARIARRLY
ncbi:MAG: glycosyltransferase family 2 protein [Muribaculaceae bacterium]|nr:glycosyltransferase family 2 protein [Muribaculaceae bacterium]